MLLVKIIAVFVAVMSCIFTAVLVRIDTYLSTNESQSTWHSHVPHSVHDVLYCNDL